MTFDYVVVPDWSDGDFGVVRRVSTGTSNAAANASAPRIATPQKTGRENIGAAAVAAVGDGVWIDFVSSRGVEVDGSDGGSCGGGAAPFWVAAVTSCFATGEAPPGLGIVVFIVPDAPLELGETDTTFPSSNST